MTSKPAERKHARLWPALRARPRLLSSVVFGLAVYVIVAMSGRLSGAASTLIAWNAGALMNLALTWQLAHTTDIDAIKRRALTQDQGRVTILVVVVLAAVAVMLAVGTQLTLVKSQHGSTRVLHIALSALTIVSSWLFTQTVFALHYAHDFYLARLSGAPDPLDFPGTPDPLYADFFHFSCVIGTSAQTADISFEGSTLRPVGTVHCIVSFFFNASLLALSINVAAGAMG
ncbi:DUF1345 domain-containing protein [Ramlibacter ginsenosidimutans]|uniref:DUF1345 domain-containing protein n=1 Tax=Ramlibacter ginsenosidimutans TaxID=502333 RepID=A0A934WNR2_9BURK|nr:DUF1345 domain-containing protein [Ramlibacter ginsenosidimutans]MBK6009169.1 DUF1345 domain-containing protein [Ramlibacter ginsenosidimutans]